MSQHIMRWLITPSVEQHEDGLWYPRVTTALEGDAYPPMIMEFDFPLDDEATAMTFARTFARDEAALRQRSLDAFMRSQSAFFG